MFNLGSALQQAAGRIGGFLGGIGQNVGQDFSNFGNQIQSSIYQPIGESIREATLPITQIGQGLTQRVGNAILNAPAIAPSVPTPWQKVWHSFQDLPNRGLAGSEMDMIFTPDRFNYQEQTPSADMNLNPPNVIPDPRFEASKQQVMPYFTPLAQFQLSAIPAGEIQPNGPPAGALALGGRGFNRGVEFMPGGVDQGTIVHELLHTSARGMGNINWNQFQQDVFNYAQQNPQYAQQISQFIRAELPYYIRAHRRVPGEELFAQTGALMGSRVFNTPLGKYYQGIFNPNPATPYNNTASTPSQPPLQAGWVRPTGSFGPPNIQDPLQTIMNESAP